MSLYTGEGITQKRLKELFHYDSETGDLYRKYALPGAPAGKISRNHADGYMTTKIFGKSMLAHRVIWIMANGEIPDGMFVDHINHDRADNRIQNLRLVSAQENAMNMSARNRDLPQGICKRHGRFRTLIDKDGERYYLGTFDTIEEAVAAREAAKQLLGFHENHGAEKLQTKE